jgi:hypothetical protein
VEQVRGPRILVASSVEVLFLVLPEVTEDCVEGLDNIRGKVVFVSLGYSHG